MSMAGGIRAGMAFVEIKAHDTDFQAAMLRLQEKVVAVGATCRRMATQLGMFAGALAVPMVAAIAKARSFDDAMREIAASVSDLSPKQLKAIADESVRLGKAMGTAPSNFANAFLALVKAGMPLEQALKGGAKAAVEFAAIGKLEVTQAAELMTDAMNVFGVSAEGAAHAISSAADASSTDIQGMSQAMAQVGAVAGMANQNIDDTSAALAILAAGMLKGSDAGTSLKTMLLRLMTPSGETVHAMQRLGLTTKSFVDEANKPLPLPKMVGLLNEKLSRLDEVARRDTLGKLFGSDAIRAAEILTRSGAKGFEQMRTQMAATMPLAEKYKTIMGGITGLMNALETSAELLSIAFTENLGPAIQWMGNGLVWVSSKIAGFMKAVPGLSNFLAGLAAVATVVAGALTLVAGASATVNFVLNNLPFGKVFKDGAKLAPMFLRAGSVIVRVAAFVASAIGAIGSAIAALPLGTIAAIGTAIAAAGVGLWWLMSSSDKKKGGGKGKAKGQPGAEVAGAGGEGNALAFNGGAGAVRMNPEQLQAAMTAQAAPILSGASGRPIINAGEETALSMKGVEKKLDTLIEVVKRQAPAFS